MEVGINTDPLLSLIQNEHPRNVRETDLFMGRMRPLLKPAGHENVVEFMGSYHPVTTNIADLVDLRLTHGVKVFEEEKVLHAATPIFLDLFTENLFETKPHWGWIHDERARKVGGAVRAIAGYGSHIGGDLGLTIHRLRQSGGFTDPQIRNYLRKDYAPKIDFILWKTAHQLAPVLTDIQNEKARKGLTNIVWLGIAGARQYALHDARKMYRARSEDEAEHIAQVSRVRTATAVDKILSLSLEVQNWVDKEAGLNTEIRPTVIDLKEIVRDNTSRRLAKFVGSTLGKAA